MNPRAREELVFPPDSSGALAYLATIEPVPGRFALPSPEDARDWLSRMHVVEDAVDDVVAGLPSRAADPDAWALLERLFHVLLTERQNSATLFWPWPRPGQDPFSRFFQLYVFLAAVPYVRALNAQRGVPEDVWWAALADVGIAVEGHRSRYGRPGFHNAFWLRPHFRGEVYRLGRLLFTVDHVRFDPGPGAPCRLDDPAVGVHIPASNDAFSPEACDDALAQAGTFFVRHFADRGPFRVATCCSWLLDPQLADHLPETSNIVRFQRRFTVAPTWSLPADDDVVRYVFGYRPDSLDALPRSTTLQRAVVKHLESGGHWRIRSGWLEL